MKIQFKNTFFPTIRRRLVLLLLMFQLFNFSLVAQEIQKKSLMVNDYSLWQSLHSVNLSSDGKWISYEISYDTGKDTTFVRNVQSLKTYAYPMALFRSSKFLGANWSTYITAKGLHIVNLKNGNEEIVEGLVKHAFSETSQQLLVLTKNANGDKLIIRSLQGDMAEEILNAKDFVMDPANQSAVYTTSTDNHHQVTLIELAKKNKKTIVHKGVGGVSNLVWHKMGQSLAFLQQISGTGGSENNIFYYTLADRKLYRPTVETQRNFLGNDFFIRAKSSFYQLKISDDMQRVFLSVQRRVSKEGNEKISNVQLWNGNAKWVYPMEEKWNKSAPSYLAAWYPSKDRFQIISNDSLTQYMLTGDQKHAILSNTQAYEPQFAYEGPRDFYLLDLAKGEKELLLKEQSVRDIYTIPSPTGKYIAYFREKHWWIYDIKEKVHTNITRNIDAAFWHNEKEYPQADSPYGNFGWTQQDKEILLYDDYDIWAISPNGLTARRLTNGGGKQTQFRLAGHANPIKKSKPNYSGEIYEPIDLNKGMLLESTDSAGNFGYYKWSQRGIKALVFSDSSRLEQLIQSADGNVFAYAEQRYDLPPRLMVQGQKEKSPKLVLQSNPQHFNFHWGKSEVIQYKNAKGKSLKGVLYYPAQYDSSKKYPMIVFIYEKLTKRLQRYYINPSLFQIDGGINISTFTTQGYFVLAPDISYEVGDVGISATDCVVSATKEVIAKGLVKPDKIGLSGHSFGGYETNFIITQTNLFAAAIAGSGWTDLTNAYLTVGWNTGRPDMWRFESQQLRMKASLFDDQEGYDRNSPIRHVTKITTPLLTWTGNEDLQVNWSNSVSLYLAMRRLGKKHIMLLYPNEKHNLNDKDNLIDLSTRVHEWFDFHLKDAAPVAWIMDGLKANK